MPGNLTTVISDHLPKFAIIPNMLGNSATNKSNIYERDWSKFDRENFILDCFSIGWEDHVVVSVSIDFPINSKQDTPFHPVAYDYSRADWDGLHDHLRDVPWEDVRL